MWERETELANNNLIQNIIMFCNSKELFPKLSRGSWSIAFARLAKIGRHSFFGAPWSEIIAKTHFVMNEVILMLDVVWMFLCCLTSILFCLVRRVHFWKYADGMLLSSCCKYYSSISYWFTELVVLWSYPITNGLEQYWLCNPSMPREYSLHFLLLGPCYSLKIKTLISDVLNCIFGFGREWLFVRKRLWSCNEFCFLSSKDCFPLLLQ